MYFALTFESVDEILNCDHSNESYGAVLPYGTVYIGLKSTLKLNTVKGKETSGRKGQKCVVNLTNIFADSLRSPLLLL